MSASAWRPLGHLGWIPLKNQGAGGQEQLGTDDRDEMTETDFGRYTKCGVVPFK